MQKPDAVCHQFLNCVIVLTKIDMGCIYYVRVKMPVLLDHEQVKVLPVSVNNAQVVYRSLTFKCGTFR